MRGKQIDESDNNSLVRITPAGAGKTKPTDGHILRKHGSPPQVRGKHEPVFPSGDPSRITPAGAGKTVRYTVDWLCFRDHPRRCGENGVLSLCVKSYLGSPPQVRGKPNRRAATWRHTGITPAGAGKTDTPPHKDKADRDHPRGCGENHSAHHPPCARSGSPPRMRGKPLFSALGGNNSRITPADAGKTIKKAR